MIGIRECKIHGMTEWYLKADGRKGECKLCKKARGAENNNPPARSHGPEVAWRSEILTSSWMK